MSIVEFHDVHFRLGNRTILNGLTFAIEPGETLVLLGRSGSGKTTALRLINGMHLPTSGDVRVEGRTTLEWDRVRLRRGIGYVIQEGGLFPHFTIEQNIGLIPRLENWPAEKVAERVRSLLESVSLPAADFADRLPRELSGGQRQRIGIARALAVEPRLIVCDEAVSALDVSVQAQIVNLLQDLQEELGLSYLFISHDLAVVEHISHDVVVMYRGEIVEKADAASIYRQPQHEYTRNLLASVPSVD